MTENDQGCTAHGERVAHVKVYGGEPGCSCPSLPVERRPESIVEQVIRDVEQHSSAAKNAVTGDLVGYFVSIDQWRALRSLLRTIPPE